MSALVCGRFSSCIGGERSAWPSLIGDPVVQSARRCPMTVRPNRQILLAERPTGKLEESHFKVIDSTIGEPAPGELLVRTILLSIDPANRAWMQGRTYREQLGAGEVMAGGALCEVV